MILIFLKGAKVTKQSRKMKKRSRKPKNAHLPVLNIHPVTFCYNCVSTPLLLLPMWNHDHLTKASSDPQI